MNARQPLSALSAAALASGLLLLAGCGNNNAISGKGAGTIDPDSATERLLEEGNNDDMRLGLDRYKGLNARFPDTDGDLMNGRDRENGVDGFEQDDANRWSDYPSKTEHPRGMQGSSMAGPDPGTLPQRTGRRPPAHDNARLDHRADLAERIAGMPAVRHANVLVSDKNAYVAVFTEYGSQQRVLTPTLRNAIAAEVRKVVPNVQQVYVSDEPAFFRQVDRYASGVSTGRPAGPYVHDFNAYAAEMFPIPNR